MIEYRDLVRFYVNGPVQFYFSVQSLISRYEGKNPVGHSRLKATITCAAESPLALQLGTFTFKAEAAFPGENYIAGHTHIYFEWKLVISVTNLCISGRHFVKKRDWYS